MRVATAQESDTYETVILDEGSKRLWMATNAGEWLSGIPTLPATHWIAAIPLSDQQSPLVEK